MACSATSSAPRVSGNSVDPIAPAPHQIERHDVGGVVAHPFDQRKGLVAAEHVQDGGQAGELSERRSVLGVLG
jgi:hypothetical protein